MEELKFPEETSSGPRSIRPRIVVVIRRLAAGKEKEEAQRVSHGSRRDIPCFK